MTLSKAKLRLKYDYNTKVSDQEVSFAMVDRISTSWDGVVKLIPDWKATIGETFLRKYVCATANLLQGNYTHILGGYTCWILLTPCCLLPRMIELAPETVGMFGFRSSMRFDDPDLMKDEKFHERALAFMGGLDMTVGMLGPDVSLLTDALFELGVKHKKVPCQEEHWPVVCESAIYAVKHELGEKFTKEFEMEWILLFRFVSYHMIQGFRS